MNPLRFSQIYHYMTLLIVFLIMAIPIVTTLIYALSSSWGASILPDSLSFKWFIQLWQDARFLAALGRSLLISCAAIVLTFVLLLPLIFFVTYYAPKSQKIMNFVILIPFAMPPIVSSIGLMQIYSEPPFLLTGTPWILLGCYFTIALPFVYRSIINSVQTLVIHDLIDCATLFGANKFYAFLRIILPNLRHGVLSGLLLAFSFLIGEFVFANILVGNRFETLQVYLFNTNGKSGHFASAIVSSYFFLVMLLSFIVMRVNRKKG